ncbi:MAG: PepSY-associated TM helix domain-containing protein [Pseudomonadota bacterium]
MKGRWLSLHRWVGLKLSILISFVMITGTFAVISHEIDWLIDSGRRVSVSEAPEHLDWQGLHDAARSARPEWAFTSLIAPIDPWHAAEVWGYNSNGEIRRLLFHPATFEFRGERAWFNAQRLFRDAHRRLMIPTFHGVVIVSTLSILLAISIVSGLYVYKKFWRGFFKKPRTRDARTLWGDLHRLGGIWSLWFTVIIALTGLFYLAESLGARAARFDIKAPQSEPAPLVGSLTEYASRAKQHLPDYDIALVGLPAFAGRPIEFYGQSKAILVRDRANRVHFDSQTGAVVGVFDGRDATAWQRVSEAADPLHFGTFGGIWTKLLYFVFGAILSALSLSGVYIYSARIRKAANRPTAVRPPALPEAV